MSKEKTIVETRFLREKRWIPTTRKDALRIIADEMPEADAEGTLAYILSETEKGRQITLGECRFRPPSKRNFT